MSIGVNLRAEVFARGDSQCADCGAEDNLQVDHIWPTSKGGRDVIENLQLLCRSCNSSKADRLPDLYDTLLEVVDIDAWIVSEAKRLNSDLEGERDAWRRLAEAIVEREEHRLEIDKLSRRLTWLQEANPIGVALQELGGRIEYDAMLKLAERMGFSKR